ncbi:MULTISPECIES: cytidine deaminase family protein [Shouchella]|uniref:Cytidine deaminase n=1 Tax=Shouchella clausii (strain KSM-K16) TaxID=66692 RepID=Q5WKT7_SHOC1|nr:MULTISPECIES: cytidine deaminase [Shouchella]MCM3314590.1 cytidine deaminase [Psychrobacillus sp. MER TA 17]MBX0317411.1 cytidine deaminase [Shouchella clausii]MDO7283483.1 cytidine deaminase [Shouchella clausii]MDO7303579.1 cytidine deaminase [Shouchella clausii]PAD44854.1 cytidine deaminase [Shouchella clausii]
MTFDQLYVEAKAVIHPRKLSDVVEVGGVGAAIETAGGNIYTGVCIDMACSIGFCAEHAAAAAVITAGESHIKKMIAVDWDGRILPPCGRCREFVSQMNDANSETQVMVAEDQIVSLQDLLPYSWREKK